jgi:hypothetical protein
MHEHILTRTCILNFSIRYSSMVRFVTKIVSIPSVGKASFVVLKGPKLVILVAEFFENSSLYG